MSKQGRKCWKVEKAKVPPTLLEIAWIAGIIEGEGCIWGGPDKSATEISVMQKEPWILKKLQKFIGGSLGTVSKQGALKRTYWRWRVSGTRARGLGFTVFSFLSPHKRDQVKRLIHGVF